MRPTKTVRLNAEQLEVRTNPAQIAFDGINNQIVYTAGGGETNVVTVISNTQLTIQDTGVTTIGIASGSESYFTVSGNTATYTGFYPHGAVSVNLGDQNDTLTATAYSARVRAP